MSDVPDQVERVASISTPYDKDALVLNRLEASEGVVGLFGFRIDATAKQGDPTVNDSVRTNFSAKIQSFKNGKRVFNGVSIEVQVVGIVHDRFPVCSDAVSSRRQLPADDPELEYCVRYQNTGALSLCLLREQLGLNHLRPLSDASKAVAAGLRRSRLVSSRMD